MVCMQSRCSARCSATPRFSPSAHERLQSRHTSNQCCWLPPLWQELARLGEGATFGERALLKSEPRFANIQATSKLKTMCISKEGFERALGATLHELLEDKY